MRASPDELKALFKQAFEACGYDFGGYEVAAEMVVWSQMHGFNVFPMIKECLLPLAQDSLIPKVLLDEPHKLVFDNQGHSVLVNASQMVNLACAKALDHGFCVTQVRNCAHPVMLVKFATLATMVCMLLHIGMKARPNKFWSLKPTLNTLVQSCAIIPTLVTIQALRALIMGSSILSLLGKTILTTQNSWHIEISCLRTRS
jgi:hypothetical protein